MANQISTTITSRFDGRYSSEDFWQDIACANFPKEGFCARQKVIDMFSELNQYNDNTGSQILYNVGSVQRWLGKMSQHIGMDTPSLPGTGKDKKELEERLIEEIKAVLESSCNLCRTLTHCRRLASR